MAQQFDPKTVDRNDWGVMIPGAVILLATFLPWITAKVSGFGVSSSESRSVWSGDTPNNVLALLACVLSIGAAAWVAMRVFGKQQPSLPTGPALTALALSAVGLLLLLLWMLLFDATSVSGGAGDLTFSSEISRGFGAVLATLAAIAQTVFAYLAFQASGEAMAFDSAKMPQRGVATDRDGARESTPQAYAGPGGDVPPAAGYAPEPPAGYAPPSPEDYSAPAETGYSAPADASYAAPAAAGHGGHEDAGYGAREDAGYGGPADAGYTTPPADSYAGPAGYGAADDGGFGGQSDAGPGAPRDTGYRADYDPDQPPPPAR